MAAAHGSGDHAHGHAKVDFYTGIEGNFTAFISIQHHVDA